MSFSSEKDSHFEPALEKPHPPNMNSGNNHSDVDETSADIEKADNANSLKLHPSNVPPPNIALAHQFPEGGKKAWLAVVGCWCVMFMAFGYSNCWG
jgi:hypothetical protein